jgi:hypothetical protein
MFCTPQLCMCWYAHTSSHTIIGFFLTWMSYKSTWTLWPLYHVFKCFSSCKACKTYLLCKLRYIIIIIKDSQNLGFSIHTVVLFYILEKGDILICNTVHLLVFFFCFTSLFITPIFFLSILLPLPEYQKMNYLTTDSSFLSVWL